MSKDESKTAGRTHALRCCMIAVAVTVCGGVSAYAQSTATSNASASPTPGAQPAGKLVIAPQFEEAWPFADGLARVKQNGKWGFVDRTGAFVIAPSFEDAESFSEERAEIKLNGKWGFIDKSGKVVVPPELEGTRRFTEGLAAVKPKGKWGYIDKTGAMAIPPTFKSARSFSEGLAAVVVTWGLGATKWVYIDTKGTVAIEAINADPKHDHERIGYATAFSEGVAVANNEKGMIFTIDKDGVAIAGPFSTSYARLWGLSEGLARIMTPKGRAGAKGPNGFLDKKGSRVIDHLFGEYATVDLDQAVGAVNVYYRGYYLLDKTEMPIEHPSLLRKYVFAEGLASVELNRKWGFIDKTGAIVIPALFDDAYRFACGVALVVDRTGFKPAPPKSSVQVGVYGYVDRTGAMVIGPYPLQSDRALSTLKDCSEGLVPVVIDGKWGYAGRDP